MPRPVICFAPILLAACAQDGPAVRLPAPGAVEVSVLVRPVVDGPGAEIELRALAVPAPVPIRVVDAADGTREVQPLEPLRHATLYTVWLDGAPASTFRTTMNPRLGTLVYGKGGVSVTRFGVDRSGLEVVQDRVDDPGPDGEWLTLDDGIGSYTAHHFEGLLRVQTVHVNAPGPDAAWHTADDPPVGRTRLAHNAQGFLAGIRSDQPGTDGQLDTADDVPAAYSEILRDEAGRDVAQMVAYTPGPDNAWFTDDDFSSGATIEHDSLGRRARVVGLEPGPDGLLFTSDDVQTGRTQNLFDADGRWSDNLVFDADDQLVEHHVLERATSGLILRIVSYGPDPDVPETYTTYAYDAQGNRVSELGFLSPGPDGIWFNADDPVRHEGRYAEVRP